MEQLEKTFDLYFGQKAPQLPANVRQAIVNFAPWITVVLLVLALPAILAILGLSAVLSPFIAASGAKYYLGLILVIIVFVLQILALPGLFKKTRQGWVFSYYAVLVSAVNYLVGLQLFNFIISTAIGLYILFQIKSYYK